MLIRVIVGIIGLPIMLFALYAPWEWVLPAFLTVIVVFSVYEMLISTGITKNRTMLIASTAFAAIIVPWVYLGERQSSAIILVFIYVVVLFALSMINMKSTTFAQLSAAFFASIFIPLAFSSILRIRRMEYGEVLVVLPFITSWITDSCAYFTGIAIGKHKLAPQISPKKTIEGAVGGLLGSVIFSLVYGLIIRKFCDISLSYAFLAIIGAAGSVIAQFGDLSMSFIKREYGIKDYGTILPGHGGILDRFDSILFAAPAVELLIMLMI